MKPDINTRFNNAIADVVTETRNHDWKKVIEAVEAVASMVKSSGFGPRGFLAIIENLHIRIKRDLGQPALEEYMQVLKHREHYRNNNLIMLPPLHSTLH